VIRTCQKCFSADDVSYRRLPDQMLEYRCLNTPKHPEHSWLATVESGTEVDNAPAGVTDELMEPPHPASGSAWRSGGWSGTGSSSVVTAQRPEHGTTTNASPTGRRANPCPRAA
jgi:hypothetical protein